MGCPVVPATKEFRLIFVVTIIQAYIPEYRVDFFEELIRIGHAKNLDIRVLAGTRPLGKQRGRNDGVKPTFLQELRQIELRLGPYRFVFRPGLHKFLRDSDALVLEQARRNIDCYRILLPKRLRPRVALWGHGDNYVELEGRLRRWLRELLTRRADWFFAYTDRGATAVRALGVPPERVTVLQNSTNTAQLRRELERIPSDRISRLAAAIDDRGSTAVFIGGLDEDKRIDFLLAAAELIAHELPNFRLIIAGDGALRSKVSQAAESNSYVHYAGRAVGADKAAILLLGRLLLVPGRVGLVAVDSLTAGVPIVTCKWPFHAPEFDYLKNGETALVTSDNLIAYAAGVVSLLVNPARLNHMSERCRASSRSLGTDLMARRFADGLLRLRSAPFDEAMDHPS